jgi:hypothetical protein
MNVVTIAAALSLSLAGSGLVGAEAGQAPAGSDPKIGTHITITGCLHKGTTSGSYVLLGVTERPAGAPASSRLAPYAIYWLDSNDGLKPLVGEMVDVTGEVKSRRPNQGTITVSFDPNDSPGTDVRVASNGKSLNVETKKFEDTPQAAHNAGSSSSLQVSRPVYKLDVENVRAANIPVAGPACR